MTMLSAALAMANDATPDVSDDHAQILEGLRSEQKWISPKYFYDERGSELFDEICRQPEYYPTRTELALMDRHLDEIAHLVGPRASVIEFGAGSSVKVRKLLDSLEQPAAYVPVEISADYLVRQAEELARDYPDVHVQPVFADFTRPFELPDHPVTPERNLVFFPGSTIGNFTRPQAADLLKVMKLKAGAGGALLIGVDLRKDPAVLHAAYNDSQGVTAAFNLNVLARFNRELGANFDLANFRHEATYDHRCGRIEMRLVSTRAQLVVIAGTHIPFAANEHIITEYSHKYSVDEFVTLAEGAGFNAARTWIDDDSLFSIHYMETP